MNTITRNNLTVAYPYGMISGIAWTLAHRAITANQSEIDGYTIAKTGDNTATITRNHVPVFTLGCPSCDGTGVDQSDPGRVCSWCYGSGEEDR